VFPEIPEAWIAVHRRALAGETITMDKERFVRADGRVQWLEWVVWPWKRSGCEAGGIIIFSAEVEPPRAAEAPSPSAPAPNLALNFNRELCRTNAVLNLLPDRLLDVLAAEVTPVAIRKGDVVIDSAHPLKAVLFPLSGLFSTVRTMEDGSTYEVTCSGRSCRGCLSVLYGDTAAEADTIALLDCSALSMSPGRFAGILADQPEIRAWIEQLAEVISLRMQRSIGCIVRHTTEQRVARWLLNAADSAQRQDLAISQDTIAGLLGMRRAGVSEIIATMREKRLVDTGRSLITVKDRLGLMAMACPCYRGDIGERNAFLGVDVVAEAG
jgi:CRP-like cAMP-binding protein